MRKISYYIIAAALLVALPCAAAAKKPKEQPKPKVETAYEKIFKDKKVKTVKGLITLHKIDDKIYFELPLSVLGQRMLMGTTVEAISDPQESAVGIQTTAPVHVLFDRTDSLVLIRRIDDSYRGAEACVADALARSNIPAIEAAFPIIACSPDNTSVLFEATDFFVTKNQLYSALDPGAYNSMGGMLLRKPEYVAENSMPLDIAAFGDNVSVTSALSYKVTLSVFGLITIVEDKPVTANFKRTFLLLPDEPMRPRLADGRIGTAVSSQTIYSDDQQGAKPLYYANRWNLRGGKRIVFYVDPNFPADWVTAIERSVAEWNRAFEAIGIKDAIQTRPFADGDFDRNNIKYSTIRYESSPSKNIRSNVWVDPRSGEILSANIYIGHGVPVAIQRDRFLQTAAADPRARYITLPNDIIVDAISSMLMRHMGHCLGLTDNLAASHTYASESLRSASFTAANGISPSVMDVLPFNYLASSDGAAFQQTKAGVYDYYVIRWLYDAIEGDETTVLNRWITERQNDPAYTFRPRQNRNVAYDPRTLEKDLGGNSMESSEYGIKNLATVIAGANRWLDAEDYDYTYRQEIYDNIVDQALTYFNNVLKNVGGIHINEKYAGDPYPSYEPVDRETQRNSLQWILAQIDELAWVDNTALNENAGVIGSVAEYCQQTFSEMLFSQIEEMGLSELKSSNPYTQQQAMKDIGTSVWRAALAGRDGGASVGYQQNLFVDNLIKWSKVAVGGAGSLAGISADTSFADEAQAQQDAVRPPLRSISYNAAVDKTHIWYGMLLDTRRTLATAARQAPGEQLRNHYEFLLFKIDRALKKE